MAKPASGEKANREAFFDHDPTTDEDDHARSFYFAPSATVQNGILHIGLGSGERNDLNCTSSLRGCDVLNRFYILKDRDVWESGSAETIDGRDVDDGGDLTDVTSVPDDCPAIEPKGLFFTVADGEKFTEQAYLTINAVPGGKHPTAKELTRKLGEVKERLEREAAEEKKRKVEERKKREAAKKAKAQQKKNKKDP